MGSGEGDAIDYWYCYKHNLDVRSREDHLLHEEIVAVNPGQGYGHSVIHECQQDRKCRHFDTEKAPS